jgi:hypothetical protein
MVDSFVGQRTNIDAKHNTMRDFGVQWWTISVKTDSFFIGKEVSGSEITL